MALALETGVLHDVDAIAQRLDRLVAEPLVIVPAKAALVERQRAGEIHRELAVDDVLRPPLVERVRGQRDAVAMQADLDALDLVRHPIVLSARSDQLMDTSVALPAGGV